MERGGAVEGPVPAGFFAARRGQFKPKGPPPSPEVWRDLAPFLNVSALASTLFMAAVGALFLLPLAYAERQGWTGGGVVEGLVLVALPALVVVFLSNRGGVRMQLRPLGQVATALRGRLAAEGAPRVRGRLRKGWGVSYELALQGGALRVVAARGQRSRPELYLVRGEREYRFRAVRDPLPELEDALRAVGL